MIDKLAQKRSRFNKWREKGNFLDKAFERSNHKEEFEQIMTVLREVDDSVREIATGEKGSSPGETLNDLIRVAETNFKRREYMVAISYLGRFHERVEAINVEFSKLTMNVDSIHHRFLFEDVDPEQVEYLTRSLAPKFHKHKTSPAFAPSWLKDDKGSKPKSKAANNTSHTIVVEAGIKDWWHNITTDRGKELASWEKKFPKYSREMKSQTNSMITRSQALFTSLLTTLKQLDTYRATRKLENYMQTAQKWRERYRGYNAAFIAFYNSQIRRFIDYQEDQQKKKEERENKTSEQLGQADTEVQGGNTPKNWPPQASGKKSHMPLTPLTKDDPLPTWDDLPPSFQQAYIKFQSDNKKMKPWEDLKDKEQRLYYNVLVMRINEARAKENVVFPAVNPAPVAPLAAPSTIPESPAKPAMQETPSIMAPPPAGEVAVPIEESSVQAPIPSKPTVFYPKTPASKPKSATPPFTGTLRSPGIQQDTLNSPPPSDFYYPPAVSPQTRRDNESITSPVFDLVNPKIPPPPPLPRDMMGTSRPRRAHDEFILALEAKGSEHPMVQAAFVLDYAQQIEQDEPEQSKQLRTLASSILGK